MSRVEQLEEYVKELESLLAETLQFEKHLARGVRRVEITCRYGAGPDANAAAMNFWKMLARIGVADIAVTAEG